MADLSQVDTDDCYKNIVNCYTDSDGCWALPLLFRPGLLYCKSQENAEPLSQAQCLTDLQDLLCVKSNFHYDGYYNLFNELYPASSASIFALGAQEVNESALREFLTVTEAVVQAQNITSEFDPLFGDGEDTAGTSDGQHLAVDIPVSMNWYARPLSDRLPPRLFADLHLYGQRNTSGPGFNSPLSGRRVRSRYDYGGAEYF